MKVFESTCARVVLLSLNKHVAGRSVSSRVGLKTRCGSSFCSIKARLRFFSCMVTACNFPHRGRKEGWCLLGLIFHQPCPALPCLVLGLFSRIDAGIPPPSLSVNGAPYLALSSAAATITTNNLCFTSRSGIDSFSRLGRTL